MESEDKADMVSDGDDLQDLQDVLREGLQGFVAFCQEQGEKRGHSVELAIKFAIERK
jgi:hypothetical protein